MNTASGDVGFDQVGGDAEVNSASGDVKISRVQGGSHGEHGLRRSGDRVRRRKRESALSLWRRLGRRVRCVTEDPDRFRRPGAGSVREGDVVLQTASGDIEVGVKKGSKLWIDARSMSGETSSEFDVGDAAPEGEGPLVEIQLRPRR